MPGKQRRKWNLSERKRREREEEKVIRDVLTKGLAWNWLLCLSYHNHPSEHSVCMCHIKIRSHTTRDYIYTPGWPRYDPVQLTKKKKEGERERERESVYIFERGISFFFSFSTKENRKHSYGYISIWWENKSNLTYRDEWRVIDRERWWSPSSDLHQWWENPGTK